MQGYIDLVRVEWLPGRNLLRGVSRITGGDAYVVTIATNGYRAQSATVNDSDTRAEVGTIGDKLATLSLAGDDNAIVEWTVQF